MSEIRLQKFMADAGLCSRRSAEKWIADGRVSVNDTVITAMGTRVDPTVDIIKVDGEPVDASQKDKVTLVMHKPPGFVCTAKDPEGRRTVYSLLPPELPRVFSVGRLDYNTEGLLLFTNDGQLANALTHPATGILREYEAKVKGHPNRRDIQTVSKGFEEDGQVFQPVEISFVRRTRKNCWYRVLLKEGKYHEVHRLFETANLQVLRLVRVAFGPIQLGDMALGGSRTMYPDEIQMLRSFCNLVEKRKDTARYAGQAGPPLPKKST